MLRALKSLKLSKASKALKTQKVSKLSMEAPKIFEIQEYFKIQIRKLANKNFKYF